MSSLNFDIFKSTKQVKVQTEEALLPDCLNTSEVCYKHGACRQHTHRLRPHVECGYIPLWWFSSLFYTNVPDCTVCHVNVAAEALRYRRSIS